MQPEKSPSFESEVARLFREHFIRICRYLGRLSGNPDLAADLTQETFIRLQQRGSLPDSPEAWLISVAMNLFRNEANTVTRRRRLLEEGGSERLRPEPARSPERDLAGLETQARVRAALERLTERDRHLLLLQAEGYGYRDLARVLDLNEASVGVLLARARHAFRSAYGE